MLVRRRKDPTVQMGIGSGNGQHWDTARTCRQLGSSVRKVVRDYVVIRDGKICARCATQCTGETGLYVHHIDMDHGNNAGDNLAILCRTCHYEIHRRIRTAFRMKGISRQLCIDMFAESRSKTAEKNGNPATGIRGEGAEQHPPQPQRLGADTRFNCELGI